MNRIYRLVWNHTLRVMQVASELAHAPRHGMMSDDGGSLGRQRVLAVACAAVLAAGALPAAHAQATGTAGADGSNATATTPATDGAAGGVALTLGSANGSASNGSALTGGAGGAGGHVSAGLTGNGGNGGAGGDGVTGSGFTLTNNGQVQGGYGGQGGYATQGTGGNGGNGGAGVSGSGFTLANKTDAVVRGGSPGAGGGSNATGGTSQVAGTDGHAGAGVAGTGFTLTNGGAIAGGWGFFSDPFSVSSTTGMVIVTGSFDGVAGGDGVYVGSGSTTTTITNSLGGQIAGGDGGIDGSGSDAQVFDGGAGIRGTGFTLTNGGYITGGPSGSLGSGNGGAGGEGITGTGFTVTNAATGTIVGGVGGTGSVGIGGSGFTLANAGSIDGGRGGFGEIVDGRAEDSGAGGAAVSGSGFTATNSGTITGGMGGHGQWIQPQYANSRGNIAQGGAGGAGGAGVTGTSFTLTNSGTIAGGYGRYGGSARWDGTTGSASGGAGISLTGGVGGTGGVGVGGTGFTVTNDGTITGGNGGAGGGTFYVGSDLSGVHFVLPGAGVGGAGVEGSAFTLVNNGTIQGGNGAYGGQGNQEQAIGSGQYQIVGVPEVGPGGSAGGAGVYVSSASASTAITNNVGATIVGGKGNGNYGWGTQGGAGGAGISGTGFTLASSGSVMGGDGGVAGSLFEAVPNNPSPNTAGAGGAGGAGITGAHFTVTNQAGGSITGGTGNRGGYGYVTSDSSGAGGAGGAGISGADFTLINAGQVTGGNGGARGALGTHASSAGTVGSAGTMGLGGVGVVATGEATILDAGGISGGLAGDGKTRADAVDLSGGGNTLTLEAGYSFTGNVVSTSGTTNGGDTLALGGSANARFDVSQIAVKQPSTYAGTSQFYGFTTYEKTGSSTWSLTGAYATPVHWVIEQGALDLSGITGGVAIDSLSGTGGSLDLGSNTLTLVTSASQTFAGAVSGDSLTLQGSGTQILDGQATFAANTTIAGGTLEIGDSDSPSATLTSPQVLVQSGGVLRGHGTVIGNVANSGDVRPGGSVGVLTVHGDYTQNAAGTLTLDVTPTQASELKVAGQARLAGTLNLVCAPGTYAEHTYTLVQADALTGRFATTTTTGATPAALLSDVVYSPTAVYLALTTIHPADGALYGNLQRAVNLANQQTLGTVLDAALGSGELPSNIARDAHHPGLWVQSSGSNLSLDGSPGLDGTGFGLLGGFDAAVTGALHVGVEAGVNQLNTHDALGGNGRIQSAHAGLYAFADAGPLVISATVDGQHQSDRIERVTGIGKAASSPAGHALTGGLQVAWPLQAGGWQFTPKLGMLYQHQVLDAFTETVASDSPVASAYGVTGARSTYNTLQPYALVTLAHAFQVRGVRYVPQIDVGYRHDLRDGVPTVMATAADGTVFALPGTTLGRDMATVGARMTAEAGRHWSLFLDYQGQFARHLHDNALSVGFTRHF